MVLSELHLVVSVVVVSVVRPPFTNFKLALVAKGFSKDIDAIGDPSAFGFGAIIRKDIDAVDDAAGDAPAADFGAIIRHGFKNFLSISVAEACVFAG